MELEQPPEKCYLDKLPRDIENIIFFHIINPQQYTWDIQDYYDEIKPLAMTNKFLAGHIPDWFINWWSVNRKSKENLYGEYEKFAIAANCGAGGWITRQWLSEYNENHEIIKVIFNNAIPYPNYNILNWLLEVLSQNPIKSTYVQRILIRSIFHANIALTQLALHHKADVNKYGDYAEDNLLWLPLMYAFEYCQQARQQTIIELLIEAGADSQMLDENGKSPYQYLEQKYKDAFDKNDGVESLCYQKIKDLIKKMCYLDALPNDILGLVLSYVQSYDGDIKDSYAALENFARTNKKHAQFIPTWFIDWWYLNRNPQKEHSKIAIASSCGATGWVKEWLKKNESRLCQNVLCYSQNGEHKPFNELYERDSENLLPFMLAMIHMNRQIVLLLSDAMGGLKEKRDWINSNMDLYFLSLFMVFNKQDKGEIILDKDLPIYEARKCRHDKIILYLLPLLQDEKARKEFTQELIGLAILKHDERLLKFAIDHGADPNGALHEYRFRLPLTVALYYNSDLVRSLLNLGADPYHQDIRGITPYQDLLDKHNDALSKKDVCELFYTGMLMDLFEKTLNKK